MQLGGFASITLEGLMVRQTLVWLLLSLAAVSCAPEESVEDLTAKGVDAGLEEKAATSAPSSVTCTGATLASTQTLTSGKGLCSQNRAYAFGLRSDGNLVLSAGTLVTWQAGIKGGVRLVMQGDGNLVVYSSTNAALWSTRTAGKSGAALTMQDDGKVVLRHQGAVLWSAGTRDECPHDPNKVVAGSCGCGTAEGTCATQGELKIVVFSVGSADSALIVFPTGATMLVDSATEGRANSRVIPFLKRHRISRLNYYAETHPHPDHVGGEGPLKANGFITSQTKMWDWESFKFGDKFDLEGTKWFIYNARDTQFHSSANTPDDEDTTNANSLSFRMEYNGFVYSATGDEGRRSQQRFLNTYPNLVRAHVRNTAHHLWGPVVPAFDKATDPFLFIVSSEPSVKEEDSWATFMGVVRDLKNGGGRLREYAFTPDTGHVFVRARNATDWSYSYCKSVDSCVLW